MKKQRLKQLSCGALALVLGVSTVSIFPAGAYAEPAEDPVIVGDLDLAMGPVNTDGDVEGDLADGGSNDGGVLLNMATSGEEDEYEYDGGSSTGRLVNNYDAIQKVVNVGESFTVQATEKANITTVDMSSNLYRLASVEDEGEDEEGVWGPKFATEDQLTVVETTPGVYTVTPLQAGSFLITLQAFVMTEGGLANNQLDIYLTAVATTTEAAKTVTDIMNEYAEANTIANRAYREFWEVYYDENATEEQKAAAEAECDRKVEVAFSGIEQKEVNAFGDDSMAIWDAAQDGKELSTKVAVGTLTESEVDEKVKTALLDELDITFAGNVKYYDVDVKIYADGVEIGTLKELTGKQTVVIDGLTGAAAGYKRVFKVLAYHTYYNEEGVASTKVIEIDDVEFDEATGSIIFSADKFSTYLVAYKDVFAPSVNTGAATFVEGGSATTSVSLSVVAVVVVITLAGAVKFAKVRK